MSKRLVSLLTAGALLAVSCAGLTASAVELDMDTPSGTTVVRTSCDPAYIVEIPADMQIPFGSVDTSLGVVSAKLMKIEANKAVYVTVESANGSALADEQGELPAIPYGLSGAEEIVFDEVNDPTEFALNVHVEQSDWDAAYAGSYADTLTFTVNYR